MLTQLTFSRAFFLVFLLHLVADYVLQGCLCDLKCKKWWEKQIARLRDEDDTEVAGRKLTDEEKNRWGWHAEKYRHDYKCGLLCHSLMWTLVTFAPFIFFGKLPDLVIWCIVIGNTAYHYWVDDKKANEYLINLCEDQFFHLVQIGMTVGYAYSHWL